ncbi:GspE/PulE family protein [Gilvimarinus sp. 1_MG-2023]|uniref:GspE/PulE family protein n=1 Tax=Gilvimarinus sp. 1_MG-2023 TaxID=3062638 RepID=UPI0026E3916B|nr:ATPase, T2SS/T4P/T4SS family [Gilvimarinus sp. 1_MG-2023]MDO6746797.1 ATPase, T2SS/T4P/T4SS family [Gilvimarinus sp. 1_MG-2023]
MKLGEHLVQENRLTQRDVERALLAQTEMGGYFGEILVSLGLIGEPDLLAVLSRQLDVELLAPGDYPDEPVAVSQVPEGFWECNRVVPLKIGVKPEFAACVPQDVFLKKALTLALGCECTVHLGAAADIAAAIKLRQHVEAEESDVDELALGEVDGQEFVDHLKDLASEAPVIRLVNQIIHQALDMGASDIHVEPFEDDLHLRYRVDGVIQDAANKPDLSLAPAIASRLKLLARMNIAERRLPQDGRIMTRVKGHELDLRVSTIPTVHGESIVMRVLDRDGVQLSLSRMGFAEDNLTTYTELLNRSHGVLLVTGPTGSGKTTTLNASLSTLDSTALKIITVEDPVEYQIDGINQIQVQSQIDLTFARSLRAILRQDPDIIMIGEMRDGETAQIAVQSALTGHLVLSTLHTNTAAGAITRLEDMGIERYLITSSVNGVLAQRLIRTLCGHCKSSRDLHEGEAEQLGLAEFLKPGQSHIYEAKGCAECKNSGYKGRSAIHELFVMDGAMHKAVQSGADATELHATARAGGMRTLYEDGLRNVAAGVTSLDEVLRVTQDQTETADII